VVPELDGLGGARLCARGLLALGEPVVAQGALLGDPGLAVRPSAIAVQCFCLRSALAGGGGAVRAPLDHPERAGGHTAAAPIAHVVLDHHRTELGAETRPQGPNVQAAYEE